MNDELCGAGNPSGWHCPVAVRDVRKSYGGTAALKGVSFDVRRGERFGIIGPDGAGKTTLLRILATLLEADGGVALVDGRDVRTDCRAIRQQVGYMPGRFSLYRDLTVEENLRFFAAVFGVRVEDNYTLVQDVYGQLEPFRRRRAGDLSGGMKQKLALCCALIHRPPVLLLDEPTTGVDPVSRREFWQMLCRLQAEGITTLVSTPYMDEATLCERIALMCDGSFLTIDTPEGITGRFEGPLYAVSSADMSRLLRDLKRMPDVMSCYAFGDVHHVTMRPSSAGQQALERSLKENGYAAVEVRPIRPTVEDCFMALNRTEDDV